MLRNLIG